MKTLIYDRRTLNNYREFYKKIYEDLDGKNMIDWGKFEYLGYDGNKLNEFLWYCHKDGNKYIFKNFDLLQIEDCKTHEDYQWKIIFYYFKKLIKEYPNNKLEFINDEF